MKDMARGLWQQVRNVITMMTERAAAFLTAEVYENENGELVRQERVLEQLTRKTIATLTAALGITVMFAPWVSPRFSGAISDSMLRLATILWSNHEGLSRY